MWRTESITAFTSARALTGVVFLRAEGVYMNSEQLPILQREHITGFLLQAVDEYPLVVLSCAMGYGKTTAAKELTQSPGRQVVLLGSKRPGVVSARPWQALLEQVGESNQRLVRAMERLFPAFLTTTKQPLPRELVETFAVESAAVPLLWILDDYHLVDSPPVSAFFTKICREHIPGFSVLFLTRTPPMMPMGDLVEKRHALVLRSGFLAFSKQEGHDYFLQCGIGNFSTASIAWSLCEGWPKGMAICARNYLTNPGFDPVRSPGSFFPAYFMSSFSDVERRLLMQVSLMGAFHPRQAAYVSGDNAAHNRLINLYERNAFLSHDPEKNIYRLHKLFRAYLTDLFEKNHMSDYDDNESIQLYSRAAECLMANSTIMNAIQLLSRTGREQDRLRILQLMLKPDESLDKEFENVELMDIIQKIPWFIRFLCPFGYLSMINCFVVRVSREQGKRLLEEARHLLLQHIHFTDETKKMIEGEIEIISASIDYNDLEAMLGHYEKARDLLGGDSSNILSPHMNWAYDSPHGAFAYLTKAGTYKRLTRQVAKKIPLYQRLSNGSSKNAQHLFRAEYLLETGVIQGVEPQLAMASPKSGDEYDYVLLLNIAFLKARLAIAHGDKENVFGYLEELSAPIRELAIPRLAYNLDLCKGYIASVLKMPELLPEWVTKSTTEPIPILSQSRVFLYVTLGKMLLTLNDWDVLELLVQKASAHDAEYPSLFGRIHTLIFRAVLEERHYEGKNVQDYLLQAVDLARRDGLVTCMGEYGSTLRDMHKSLYERFPEDTFLQELGKLLVRYSRFTGHSNFTAHYSNFTAREEEVISLLTSGASNREIAGKLGISYGSVSNLLTRIYNKVGAKNRYEALSALGDKEDRDHVY